jgi:hypothetical protein
VQAFLTEKPEFIAIEFEMNYFASEELIPESGILTEANLVVRGSCSCNIATYEIVDVQFDSIIMLSKEGENIYGNTFLRAESIIVGRRTISYRLKEPLDLID